MQRYFEKIIERLGKSKEYSCSPQFTKGIDYSIKIVNNVAEEFATGTNVGNNDGCCEWIKYDYRTIAPKNHDAKNPYWRIPEDMSRLRFCPYCGKEIKVVE